jgi:glycosyltransferase involved in cell wall biosynthesis
MPKVSVTIPVYNGAAYLKEAIDSVLAQTYKDFEAIVVNDGSTDNSEEILKSYGDKIRYYYQENRGLANTRNRLVELAKGEYIAFIDQDDVWMPDHLIRHIALFFADLDIGLVYSDCAIINSNGEEIVGTYYRFMEPVFGMVFEQLLRGNFISIPTVVVKKQLILGVGGFSPKYRIAEEYDLFLKVATESKFGYLPEVLAQYRRHENNNSKNVERTLLELVLILEELKLTNHAFSSIIENRLHEVSLEYVLLLVRNGRIVLAGQYFLGRTRAGQSKLLFLVALAGFLLKKIFGFILKKGRGLL